MTEPLACRFPFQHDHDTCHCTPDPIAVARDRFEANAAARSEMAKRDLLTLAMVFAVTGLVSFTSLYAVAAVVDQGRVNIKQWVAAHEPV